MRLKKVFIGSFGKFEKRGFEFSDGLNVVYGKNESGKSTLSSFINYILYGFSSQKTRSVQTNDKLKYLPWNGGAVMGSAIVSYSGGECRIERQIQGSKNILKITDETGKDCSFGKEPGEAILGMDEAAFAKIAFIRQNDISADRMSNLSDIIQNTVYSADENIDIEKARKKLVDYRNVYRSRQRKTGMCFELENRIRELRYSFDEASEMHKTLLAAEAKLIEIKNKIVYNKEKMDTLEAELRNIEGYEANNLLQKVMDAKRALDAAEAEYRNAEKSVEFNGIICDRETTVKITEAYGNYLRTKEAYCEAEENFKKARREKEEKIKALDGLSRFSEENLPNTDAVSERIKSISASRKRAFIAAAVLAVLSGICLVSGIIKIIPVSASVLSIIIPAAAVFGAAAVAMIIYAVSHYGRIRALLKAHGFTDLDDFYEFSGSLPDARRMIIEYEAKEKLFISEEETKKDNLREALEKLRKLLLPFGADENTAAGFIENMKTALEKLEAAEREKNRCASIYDTFLAVNDLHALSDAAKFYTHVPERDKKTVKREYEFFEKANASLSDLEKTYIKQAAAPASSVRKPSEILAEKQATEAMLKDANEKADAAEMALEALEEACGDLKGGISPRIASRAGELFEIFTGGKYSTLDIYNSNSGIGITDAGVRREAGYLSQGTQDAAYLALRISLCEILFHEAPVIVLDEAFAHIDDGRLPNILSALLKLSEKYQILIFTCHTREKDMLKNNSGVNIIELEP